MIRPRPDLIRGISPETGKLNSPGSQRQNNSKLTTHSKLILIFRRDIFWQGWLSFQSNFFKTCSSLIIEQYQRFENLLNAVETIETFRYMRKVWRGTDLFSTKPDLFQSRCLQLKSQKHLQIYTHFSSGTFVCIIGTFKNASASILLIFNICIISHCKSLFSCFLLSVEIHVQLRVDNPLFHNPSISTHATLSCRAAACSLLGILRERQLRHECLNHTMPPVAVLIPPAPVTGCCYHSKESQQEWSFKPNHLYRKDNLWTETDV